MEKWRELFDYSIVAKSNIKGDFRESYLVNLQDLDEDVLSPVTNLMLNALIKIYDSDENLIINFPKKILKPIPLMAYIFSEMKSKSVLIFTAGNISNKNDLIRVHNDNFYLLSFINKWGRGGNLYENCSMGYLKNKSELCYKFFLPHANTTYKNELNENIKKILGDKNKPKIVLMGSSSLTSITNVINHISVENDELYDVNINRIDLDIGCIIFENADKYFSSKHNAEFFVKWINENIGPEIKIIFHFSNHDLQYLNYIKELTKAKVISFNGGVIKNNDILIESSLNYFKNISNLDIVKRYNLDDQNDYYSESKIILDDKLDKGNLDYFTYSAKKLMNFINEDEIGVNSLYYNAQKLFLDLNNLTINPSFLKFQVRYRNEFSYVTVPQFIKLFKNSIQYESSNNQIYLDRYISFLSQFYYEISKRKRFNELKSYKHIGKDYRLLEIIENKERYFRNNNNLIIGTFYNTEPGILNRQLKDYTGVEVKYMGNLINEYYNSTNLNLLLPGFVPPKFLSELYKDYSKIYILNYDGFNRKNIINQINSIEKPSITDESKVMGYFLELYDYLGMDKDNAFVNNYKKRLENEILKKPVIEEKPKCKRPFDVEEDIENIGEETEDYNNYLDIIKDIERKINNNQFTPLISSGESNQKQYGNLKTVDLELMVQNSNEQVKKTVPAKNKYLHFKNYGALEEALEIKAENLSKGDYIIILDNEKISFIELFIEIFKLEESIDKNLTEYWKDKISIFVEDNNLSYDEFYELYKKEGGKMGIQTVKNWLKGKNISPRDYKNELLYLSKVMDDDFLLNNIDIMGEEFRKIRAIHISMGRNLKSIMKGIIVDDFALNYDSLSLEEQTMHNIIKNSVYQVININ